MGTLSGYVMNDYIVYDAAGSTKPAQPAPTPESGMRTVAIVLPSDGLNLRRTASLSSGVIMTLPQGTMLTVTGAAQGGMLPVTLGGLAGYVAAEYVYVTEQAQPTPIPQPTATPAPTAEPFAAYRATVTAASGLKLRSGPDTASNTLVTMPMGATVTVTGAAQGGFLPVSYGDLSGFASETYLRAENAATPIPLATASPTLVPEPSKPIQGRTGMVTAPSGLNLRQYPAASADVLATLGYGVQVTVTGEWTDGFYPVSVGTLSGYVSADYIGFDAAAPQPTPTPVPQQSGGEGYRVFVDSDNGLNLRAKPDTSSDVLYVLPYGMVLTVLGESENGFLHVAWANYTGYVANEFVTPFGAQ